MDWTLEVIVLPIRDLDRSIAFYADQVGFTLDHHTVTEQIQFAQLTPRGSGCSIVIGNVPGQAQMEPGSIKGLQLVVSDAEAARKELLSRGVEAGEIMVLDERDGGTMFTFDDPDGNSWVVQQIKARAEKPLIPRDPEAAAAGEPE
ncbi:VOC family protein [Arthrobacter sp. Sa2BUA2]|uniref:VOC family protein n=1 Tax=Arthrobacter pullicola TaxID=2762224 RepID=A0ABR8YHG0_9MICC|nr:VOC family protein [Arthrobacter pullicola]MBD8043404.1 VOC family protein [Arthrobacter pullicola]